MSYGEISDLRLVCQTFNRLCGKELTRAFIRVDRMHGHLQKSIKAQLPRKESERRNHSLSRFVDILSAMETRLSLLSMTYTKYIDLDLCCFIPGKVLDEMTRLLHRLQDTESQPPRSYDLLQSLRDLSTMAMEHFEENIVPILKAQMNSSLFASTSSTPLSLTPSIASSPFAPSMDMSPSVMPPLLDYSWTLPTVPMVSSPWRRSTLKLDVQRVQNQMQIHSAAIATMTKEYREQKVKIGEQNRIIAEQERKLYEHSKLILELKAHVQSQEKSLELLAKHLSSVTGKEIKLPEAKPWEVSAASRVGATSTSPQDMEGEHGASLSEMTDRTSFRQMLAEQGGDGCIVKDARINSTISHLQHLPRPEELQVAYSLACFPPYHSHLCLYSKPPMLPTTTLATDMPGFQPMQYSVNKLCPDLESTCPTSRLLAQCSLLITAILNDHNLPPLCLMEPKEMVIAASDPRSAVLSKLTKDQQLLHKLSEEHQGCATCAEVASHNPVPLYGLFGEMKECMSPSSSPRPSTSHDSPSSSRADILSSAPNSNQGLYNRCQELMTRLQNMSISSKAKNGGGISEAARSDPAATSHQSPAPAKEESPEPVRGKGKGKQPMKRGRTAAKLETADAQDEDTGTVGRSRKRRKR